VEGANDDVEEGSDKEPLEGDCWLPNDVGSIKLACETVEYGLVDVDVWDVIEIFFLIFIY
jgi:hypothetical protein